MEIDERLLDEWVVKYKPVINHISHDSGWANENDEGTMFETYGDDLDYVIKTADSPYGANTVWTWVDGDKGTYIINGYHLVNRIGYFITKVPFGSEDIEIPVDLYGEE